MENKIEEIKPERKKDLGGMLAAFAKALAENKKIYKRLPVTGSFEPQPRDGKVGDFVSVRPCDEKYQGKTFLGMYLGDIPSELVAVYADETARPELCLFGQNPLILILECKEYVRGFNSWWGKIESPDDLQQITDADINSIWYVEALKALETKNDNMETDT